MEKNRSWARALNKSFLLGFRFFLQLATQFAGAEPFCTISKCSENAVRFLSGVLPRTLGLSLGRHEAVMVLRDRTPAGHPVNRKDKFDVCSPPINPQFLRS
jgi:hypothetical protein